MSIVPVILSGGAGTRLWPLSRNAFPKQFISLADAGSSFSNTLKRVSIPGIFGEPIIVTNWDFRFLVAEELSNAQLNGRIVLEPMRRDSGAAIAVAAHILQAENPGAIMLVLAADHLVRDIEGFVQSILAGLHAAQNGKIVTFGIIPNRPATSYGYIKPGPLVDATAHKIAHFIEKPNAEKAKELMEAGYRWNVGNFLFQASTIISELRSFAPEMEEVARAAAQTRQITKLGDVSFERLDADIFARSPVVSIDYSVMEKTSLGVVVSAQHDWSDLGSWEALWEVNGKDADGNVARGSVTLQHTRNSYVTSDGLHTAVIGLEGILVVATQDAVLVAPREGANDLKSLVAMLGSDAATKGVVQRYKRHRAPWGWEENLLWHTDLVVKRVFVRPGSRLPKQKHLNTTMHYLLVKGVCTAIIEGVETIVQEPQVISIKNGDSYCITNIHDDEIILIEIQTGSEVREDDVVWLENN